MTSPNSTGGGMAARATGDPHEIRADIERTRAELGDTIEALAAKADMKAHAREVVGTAKARVRQRLTAGARVVRQLGDGARRRPARAAALAGIGAAIAALVLMTRRRAGSRMRW